MVVKLFTVTLLVGTLVLSACGPVTPQDRERVQRARQEQAENADYQVLKLFEKDGCTVYSFRDHGYAHYFSNCNGTTTTTSSSSDGKTTRHLEDEIHTYVN